MEEVNKKKSDISKKEEEILEFWQEAQIFQKSLDQTKDQPEFVFYDGPPFGTGVPHHGHMLPSSIKDVIGRYKTMKGNFVDRRWGWDCHGLPVENIVEKELGLKSKTDIENYGIDKFNHRAKQTVLRYADEWKKIIPRVGRWVDMEDDYKTMDAKYTESVWWAFSDLYKKGLAYKGYKPMHLCPRCETTLSNFEVSQGYEEITDISVTVSLQLLDQPNTSLLAWTTTPWTLPGNVALAVGEDVDYIKVKIEDHYYILAKELEESVLEGKDYLIEETFKGKDLLGKKYKPLFDYYTDTENAFFGWQIYSADFVTTEEGTGIVHIAPAFGGDDMLLGQEKSLPFIQHVKKSGEFKKEVTDFAGHFVKPKDDHQATDILIIKHLAHQGLLFSKKKIKHSYPHCWRCDTPLLNYATDSWFVAVSNFKEDLLNSNAQINWVPDHLKDGRFGKWLEGARDWSVSRSRFWGAPLPVWQCDDCEETFVASSVDEISQKSLGSNNRFLAIRHGNAISNNKEIVSCSIGYDDELTKEGRDQVKQTADQLKNEKIDLLVVSPFHRTKQTAEILAEQLGISKDDIVQDDRLKEIDAGELNGKSLSEFHQFLESKNDYFNTQLPNGESYKDLRKRVGQLITEMDTQYKEKNILFVTHGAVLWMLSDVADGVLKNRPDNSFTHFQNAEYRDLKFKTLPRNEFGEMDLHRPYIDDFNIQCSCGNSMTRIEDVFDCWFESGSMPYASSYYPQENKNRFEKRHPADFIAEGLDQTRGWFYTLTVLSTALFGKPAFKNVVSHGIVLAEDGRKMSKRLNNYPPLQDILDNYGADALRLFLLMSPAVKGEEVNFSEKTLKEISSKFIKRLQNSTFFLHGHNDIDVKPDDVLQSKNILDLWVLAKFNDVLQNVENGLESYELDKATRPLMDLADDLSNWYVRRSRDRFKSEDKGDQKQAIYTLRFIMLQAAKLSAPFAPFVSEDIHKTLNGQKESVHLQSWPEKLNLPDQENILNQMSKARELVSEGLELRSEAGIKVKQPLAKAIMPDPGFDKEFEKQFLDLIKEELNVKEIVYADEESISLDTQITDELKQEGVFREFLRSIQSMRKKKGLSPETFVDLFVFADKEHQDIIVQFQDWLKDSAQVKQIHFSETKNLSAEEFKLSDSNVFVVMKEV